MIKNLFNKLFQFFYATNKSEVVLQSKLRQEINFIKKREFERDNKNLIPFGYKVFSQTDEDGIINEIFKRIGTTNKQFLEFGVNTDFNNTTYLLFNGWKGVWLESSKKKIIKIEEKNSSFIKNKKLKLFNKIITAENVNEELKFSKLNKNLDLLSIDIDGNEQRQESKAVILSGNSIESPRLLLMSESSMFPDGLANSSGEVGRNYMRHLTGSMYARFEKPVRMYRGETMAGFCADEVKHNPNRGFVGGYYMETLALGPAFLGSFLEPGAWGREFTNMMDGYENVAGMWIVGEDLPQSKNRITLNSDV